MRGLELPPELAEHLRCGTLGRTRGSWRLRSNKDSYGTDLETELGYVFSTLDEIVSENRKLPEAFKADGYYGALSENATCSPRIPDILDFERVISFGLFGDGAPFCLDYRESMNGPCVIWWDDDHWRRVAPSFSDFLSLFDLESKSS